MSNKRIQKRTEEVGDLYVTVVVPSYLRERFHEQQYNGWYLAHTNPEQLEQEVLQKYYETFLRVYEKRLSGAILRQFFDWLCGLRLGYTLITTGPGSYVAIDIGENANVSTD